MSYVKNPLGMLIEFDPPKAKSQILAAMKAARANQRDAAKALSCHETTLIRWIAKLGMTVDIQQLRDRALREGWSFRSKVAARRVVKPKRTAVPQRRRKGKRATP